MDSSEPLFDFYFENPQPIHDSELNKFPNNYQGIYKNNDSVFLKVENKLITRVYYSKFRIHKSKLDSLKEGFIITNGILQNKYNNDIFEYFSKGDSVDIFNKSTDTIFQFSNFQKAKRIKGSVILNIKDSVFWKIRILKLEKNVLKITDIYDDIDLKKIDSITKIKSRTIDSTSFILRPSRREFVKILRIKEWRLQYEYIKMDK